VVLSHEPALTENDYAEFAEALRRCKPATTAAAIPLPGKGRACAL